MLVFLLVNHNEVKNMKQELTTYSELQVCTDASLVRTATPESLNGTGTNRIPSSEYIGEEKHDMPSGIAEIGKSQKERIAVSQKVSKIRRTVSYQKSVLSHNRHP